jgi:hypothetical protein
MKNVVVISPSVLAAASVAAIITLIAPNYSPSEPPGMPKPKLVAETSLRSSYPLNIIDGTTPDLSDAEWKSLFDGFSDRFADPLSAQVRKLARSTKKGIVCGEVNAKNRLGGYVGFVPFTAGVALPRAMIVMPERRVVEAMPEQVNAVQSKMGWAPG